jgi:soluble lytic murein transglycosylase
MPNGLRHAGLARIVLNRSLQLAAIIVAAMAGTTTAICASIEEQRNAFREVYAEAELGNWQPAAEKEAVLADYVLWPDLRAAYFRATLSSTTRDDDEIRALLQAHGTLRSVRELRYRYALRLAAENRMAEYRGMYDSHFQGLEIARLDCLALQAELPDPDLETFSAAAHTLWLTGVSQANECDPVFEFLKNNALLEPELYRQRFQLAIDARQFPLARYLSGPLAPQFREQATRWIAAQEQPETFLRSNDEREDTELHREKLVYAVQRIAYRNPQLALDLWEDIAGTYVFTPEQTSATSRHIALWSARRHLPDAYANLRRVPTDAVDTEVRRWQARASLRDRNWQDVISSIEEMPAAERAEQQWRYWQAYALLKTGSDDEAELLMLDLAGERSYYGFLAADELQQGYEFSHSDIGANEPVLDELADRESIIRARELFYVGLDGRGRSEWDAALLDLTVDEKMQAAILAQRWGWHSRAISTAAAVGHFDDLVVRFPLPYKDAFAKYSSAASVRPGWAFGVARSESLFMRDVRSSAGAIGLMQLMPTTGRSTAREINLPWSGTITLTDPPSNIRLGTHYLGKMYSRFDNNMVLATAAYNAGPGNVEQWLPQSDSLDARLWIENIPYNETRKYVRRVMETDVIFTWRLTGEVRRLSEELVFVNAAHAD